MNRGIIMRRTGGPEVLEWIVLPDEAPALGEILIRQTAVGLNFVDLYHRTGAYPMTLPAVPGIEAAGFIEAVGQGVESLHVGDRIAYTMLPGAYRERRTIAADRAILLPDDIDDRAAVAPCGRAMSSWFTQRREALAPCCVSGQVRWALSSLARSRPTPRPISPVRMAVTK